MTNSGQMPVQSSNTYHETKTHLMEQHAWRQMSKMQCMHAWCKERGGVCGSPRSSAILLALSRECTQKRMYSSGVVPGRERALRSKDGSCHCHYRIQAFRSGEECSALLVRLHLHQQMLMPRMRACLKVSKPACCSTAHDTLD